MNFKNTLRVCMSGIVISSSLSVFAHSRYIEPSHTSLSGSEGNYVSFDLSVSEDIFHPDMAFGGTLIDNAIPAVQAKELSPEELARKERRSDRFKGTKLEVVAPDGSVNVDSKLYNVGRKSVAGFKLTQSGTYRVSVVNKPMTITRFKRENGKGGRVFGGKGDAGIPEGASELTSRKMMSRIETFVTRDGISKTALKPNGEGVELDSNSSTHPNDSFVGDVSTFYFLLDGKALPKGAKVSVIRAGTRYRNNRDEINLVSDDRGAIDVTWPQAGMYFLELSLSEPSNEEGIDSVRYSYAASFEVFP